MFHYLSHSRRVELYLVLFISWLIRPYPISVSMLFLSTYRGVGLMGLNLWWWFIVFVVSIWHCYLSIRLILDTWYFHQERLVIRSSTSQVQNTRDNNKWPIPVNLHWKYIYISASDCFRLMHCSYKSPFYIVHPLPPDLERKKIETCLTPPQWCSLTTPFL